MWLRVTLALVALRVAEPLRELRSFNLDPSMISNIHLLVPLTLSDQRQRKLRISDSWEDSKEFGQHTQDEEYSAIPGYAFTLDTDSILTDKDTITRPKTELFPGLSLYLDHEWPHPGHGKYRSDPHSDEQTDKQADKSSEKLTEARLGECRALGRQHSAESRELLVQLCNELVELLATRCKCCDEQRSVDKKVDNNVGLPWFGSFDSRRGLVPINEHGEPV